jgi:hypothetical protein
MCKENGYEVGVPFCKLPLAPYIREEKEAQESEESFGVWFALTKFSVWLFLCVQCTKKTLHRVNN